jgi:hypothetical protein
MRFRDVPLYTRKGTWECDFNLEDVIPTLDKWVEEQNLDLDPDFQRVHVWTEEQQIAWVEYILRGGSTGRTIYLNNPAWQRSFKRGDQFVLVDGKQRVQALRRFFNDEIPAFGHSASTFEDRPDMIRQGFKINVNNLLNRHEVLRWYIEFNSGGTPHTTDEIDRVRELLRQEETKVNA